MREIKFRGYCKEYNEWFYGFGIWDKKNEVRIAYGTSPKAEYPLMCESYEVEKDSVGQFTGLKDCKGREIYEGDIVADILDGEILMVGDIQFDCGTFGVEWVDFKKNKSMVGAWGQKHNLRRLDDDIADRMEVIGNIYENEKLLRDLK